MRTAGQGQVAVPRERDHRRRNRFLPGGRFLGRGEKIPRTVTAVERYPDTFPHKGEGIRFLPWARSAHHGFFAQKRGLCVSPEKERNRRNVK